MKDKVFSSKAITEKVRRYKNEGKKIVLCNGFFHYLHIEHIRYLKQARNYGDIVIVSVNADKLDSSEEDRINEVLRVETVSSLEWIDAVVINPFEDICELISRIGPDVYLQQFDPEGIENDKKTSERLKKIGVKFVVAEEVSFDSTTHINLYLANLPDDIKKYLDIFKQRFSFEDLVGTIREIQKLNVLVIGDTILDEYQYCSTIGKSSKDPTLALKYESHDVFAGGVIAIANHIAGLACKVDLITILGENESNEAFIRTMLKKNVHPRFFMKAGGPTMIKRRFVDGYSMNKLLEVYVMDDSALDEMLERELYEVIRSKLSKYDLVVAADFGHGAISVKLKELISEEASFLAVNAQSNAGNRGFNNITKYKSADYVSMAEHEIRLEMRDLTGEIPPMMKVLAKRMNCRNIVVTLGRKGCMVLDNKGLLILVPSFSQRVVDRVGAGDAFFSVTSLAAFSNASPELIGFLGNVAGAMAVESVGNKKTIDSNGIIEYLSTRFSGILG